MIEPPFEVDPTWADRVGIELGECDHPNGFGIHGCPCGVMEPPGGYDDPQMIDE